MNTTDIDWGELELPWTPSNLGREGGQDDRVSDLLETIFAGQHQLMIQYEDIERRNGATVIPSNRHGQLDARDVQIRLKDLSWRMTEELGEAMNCLKNKPWKQSFIATDIEHFEEEIADALHFFVELCLTAGIDAEKLFRLYFLKHAVNQFRQESKY